MTKIPLSYQKHRQTIGNHTNWQDRNQKSQKYQDNYIQHLAQISGRHTENIRRQDIAYATLQLVAILSSVRNCSLNTAVIPQRTTELQTTNCMLVTETYSDSSIVASAQQNAINRSKDLAIETQQKKLLRSTLQREAEQVYSDGPISLPFSGLMCNSLNTILHSVSNVFHETSQFLLQYDPIRFPMATAHSLPQEADIQNVERVILEDKDGEILNLTYSRCGVTHLSTDCDLIKNSRDVLAQYYKDYDAKYPTNFKQLIASSLKETIRASLDIDIDPDKAELILFHRIADQKKERNYFTRENKTLTEWFVMNHGRSLQYDKQNIMFARYNKTRLFNLNNLLDLTHGSIFYDSIKEKLIRSYQDRKMHVKKCFIDFICHLDISGIDDEAVKDVLNGAGLLRGRAVYTSLLDINEYMASTAFCFWSESGRLTFYFPESEFKFISFQNKARMREWLAYAWSQQSQRNMIAFHFFNSEIAEQLNVIRHNTEIATGPVYIPSDRFFGYLFTQIKDKIIFEFSVLSKLAVEMSRRNIRVWENTMDVSSTIPDFTSLFSSLNTHLKNMIGAHTYYKKSEEWYTIKRSTMDTVAMSMLDKILKFPHKGGYDFIDIVIKSIETVDLKRIKPISKQDTTGKQNFLQLGQQYLTAFYEDYHSKYLGLKMLARSVLKEKIQERFHLELDPDSVRFMHFDNEVYDGGEKVHYPPARENKTLTEWLFTNFDAETQDNLQDMDSMCGIYDSSVWKREKYHSSDELKIKPTDFIRLVYDIDFYNHAKNKLSEFFKDKDTHIKKYFIDCVNHLDVSDIRNEAAKDVLSGVGIGTERRRVRTSLFDIDGYSASNAFIFRNEDGRVTLYFPESDFKFISFRGDFEMRSWVTNACSTKEHRDMIAFHFTIANRQDGTLFYGIDAWLKFIDQNNAYYDKIAIRPIDIEPEHFFDFLFTQIKEKTFSDLDSLIKSDAEIRRDMWENMIDASNVIPNPVSPFLSLGMHIEHALDADTYEEKQKEWNKITSDTVNIVTMVTLSKLMNFRNMKGYKFIHAVNKDVEIGNINQVIGIAELHPSTIFKPNSPYKDWLMSQLMYDEAQIAYDITSFGDPLETFLPLREVKINNDMSAIDSGIKRFIELYYKHYQFDVFYGLDMISDAQVPVYIYRARAKIQIHLNEVRTHLRDVSYKFQTGQYQSKIKHFLSLLVDTDDERVIDQAYSRLQTMVMRVMEFLNKSELTKDYNIALVSSKQILNVDQPFLYKSAITDIDILDDIPYGFVCNTDPYRRIHILLDALVDSPEGRNIFVDKQSVVYNTIMHEASHLSSNTFDIVYFDGIEASNTMQENIDLVHNDFSVAIADAKVNDISKPFRNFMEIIKQYFGGKDSITNVDVLRKIQNDPMLKANVIMENADTFVLCVREVARMDLAQRFKREDRNISDSLANTLLASVFTATHNDHINIQTECK